jgi:hypothetical protein
MNGVDIHYHSNMLWFVPGRHNLVLKFVSGRHRLVQTINRNFLIFSILSVKMEFQKNFLMFSVVT